jgi:NADH:ubiquinone oxidoreductase subunit K
MILSIKFALYLGAFLFSIGIYGMLTRRNAIAILLSLELILNAAILNFVAFGRLYASVQAQGFAVFIIALAACEAAVALAIILGAYRMSKSILTDELNLLKG